MLAKRLGFAYSPKQAPTFSAAPQPTGEEPKAVSRATSSDAETVTVESFAHNLSGKHLACRTDQHVWRPSSVEVVRQGRSLGGYVRVMRCSQCRTERRQTIDTQGVVLANRYAYSDGYLAARVERGVSKAVFRLEWLNRWVESHDVLEVTDEPRVPEARKAG